MFSSPHSSFVKSYITCSRVRGLEEASAILFLWFCNSKRNISPSPTHYTIFLFHVNLYLTISFCVCLWIFAGHQNKEYEVHLD